MVNKLQNELSMKNINIRATALQEFWGDKYEQSYYLWQSSKHNLPLSKIIDNEIPTLPDLYVSTQELQAGHEFCKAFYYNSLPILAHKLNQIHNTKLSDSFWQTAFGWWLYRHISVVFDKFEYLKHLDIDNTGIKLLAEEDFYFPDNHYDYLLAFTRDFGVQQLVSQYYYLFKKQDFPVVRKSASFKKDIWGIAQNDSTADPEIALLGAYFSTNNLKELKTKSGGRIENINFPIIHGLTDEIDLSKRKLLADYSPADDFEYYFYQTLYYCFPKDLLENFKAYYSAFERDILKKKFTHLVSEVWITNLPASIYVAVAKENGRTFISSEHAQGAYIYSKNYVSFMEHDAADIFLSIGWGETKGNFVKGGFAIKDSVAYEFHPSKKSVLYIGRAKFVYWEEFNTYNAVNSTFIKELKMVQDFIGLLPEKVNQNFIYRPRNEIFFWDTEMNLELRERNVNIDNGNDFLGSISRSRIVVIDHISTSIAELMMMNAPFILLHETDLIPLPEELISIFNDLKEQGVIHTTAKSAAEHIGKYYESVEAWWMDNKVQMPLSKLKSIILAPASNVVNYLISLLSCNDSKNFITNVTENKQTKSTKSLQTSGTEASMKEKLINFSQDKNRVFINAKNNKTFNYSDGQEHEANVLRSILSTEDCSIFSEELQRSINDWVTEYHFSRERHNLLRHVEFQPDWNILELGCGCGAITRQLGESGASVTAIEGSYSRAAAAAARCRDLANVKVCNANFQDVQLTEKYDVVTLIGVMEYSPLYFSSDDPIRECLEIACGALKPDGVLIIAIENQLGLKYFCGYHEDHVDIPYFGVEDRYNKNTAVTFGKKELESILLKTGFASVEFQYPFPDYKVPKTVITSKGFMNRAFHPEDILSQLKYRDYSGDVNPAFDQGMAIPVLCRNGVMADLSNSFLVFASPAKKLPESFTDDSLLGVYYTTDRAIRYNILTKFEEDGKRITVKKSILVPGATSKAGTKVLDHMLDEDQYIAGRNLESEYRNCLITGDLDRFSELVSSQVEFIEREGILKRDIVNPALSEIKDDFIDCVPSNLILKNGAFNLIDREWRSRKRISMGALLLRTVDVLCGLEPKLPEITRDNLIFSLHEAGYIIDEQIVEEYNRLITEIVAQVYNDETPEPMQIENPIWNALLGVRTDLISKKNVSIEMDIVIDRLCSHLDEMLSIYNGFKPRGYYERLQSFGSANEVEISIVDQFIKIIREAPDWKTVYDFLLDLKADIGEELRLHNPELTAVKKINPIEKYRKYSYGSDFNDFICPNPFLYLELRQHGEISSCCYLPFSIGNIEKEELSSAWNSEIAAELRRSILSGEYSYCDKSKCAAMQDALKPQKPGVLQYQIPYQLMDKKSAENKTVRKCIVTERVDDLPLPEIISFEDDPSCNLSCPSCRTGIEALNAHESSERLLFQTALLDSLGDNLKEIWLCGAGDAFAALSYRKLLQEYDFGKFPRVKFRLDTNGMLFTPHSWETILKNVQERIVLTAVSIDAAEAETYKQIRRGGDFQRLVANLRFIASLPQRKTGMSFIIRMIVQKKNFREMKKFVELGLELGVDSVVFSLMQNWGTFSNEDYSDQAVHLEKNEFNRELREILKDEIFQLPVVNLGNLSDLFYEVNSDKREGIWTVKDRAAGLVQEETPKTRARVIAFYLPQFHPIPENDLWWGKGFTEWSNVGKAKPLFEGHYQPHVPADLGYYDLRVAEARNAQAELAKQYGVEAFCYWHYWFAGKRLLERPFNDVISLGEPDFPFCLGWANQTWSGVWHGAPNKILIEQTYPGLDDYRAHFYALLPAFRDKRYLKINGKIVFVIYSPKNLPDAQLFVNCWRELAVKEGLEGFHFIAHMVNNPERYNCDSCVDNAPFYTMNAPPLSVKPLTPAGAPKVSEYKELVKYLKNYQLSPTEHPIVFPNWDNTPRSGVNGVVLTGSTPELFAEMMRNAVAKAEKVPDREQRIVFVKAWNEWAEGNHLEPDMQFGHAYLQALKEAVMPDKNS